MNQPMDLLKTSKLIQICDLVWHKHVLQFINITTIDKAVKGGAWLARFKLMVVVVVGGYVEAVFQASGRCCVHSASILAGEAGKRIQEGKILG
ncbi:hypothetical protein V1477_020341 [Vespula maculifrons]|nr:hypothetical protein HZH68_005482 [Vespula germanica]